MLRIWCRRYARRIRPPKHNLCTVRVNSTVPYNKTIWKCDQYIYMSSWRFALLSAFTISHPKSVIGVMTTQRLLINSSPCSYIYHPNSRITSKNGNKIFQLHTTPLHGHLTNEFSSVAPALRNSRAHLTCSIPRVWRP